MTDNKAELLRSLSIDRGAASTPRAPRRRGLALFAAGAVVVAVLAIAAFATPGFRAQERPDPASAQPSPPQQQVKPQSAAADTSTSEPGKLTASGYVVARRKAT